MSLSSSLRFMKGESVERPPFYVSRTGCQGVVDSAFHFPPLSVVVPFPLGIVLSAVVAGILTITGWFGGELSYRHRIGVIETGAPGMEERRRPEYRRIS